MATEASLQVNILPPLQHCSTPSVSWATKRFRLQRFCGRFAKLPPRVHQVAQVSWCLWPSWAVLFCGAKRFCGRFPHHFSKLVSQCLNSFPHVSPAALALGSSAIVKVLGQNDTFVFLGSLQQMAFASLKVFWGVPQTVLYIGLTVSCGFLGKWLLLQKRFCGGFCPLLFFTFVSKWLLLHKNSLAGSANCALHLSPNLLLGSKLRDLLTCLPHTNPVRRKRPIMSLLVGYSFGFFSDRLSVMAWNWNVLVKREFWKTSQPNVEFQTQIKW